MIFRETFLQGVLLIEPEPRADERGSFARYFCIREFSEQGLQSNFVQFNHSVNLHKGTLRGMHFQHPPSCEVKLIRCIRGAVFDVIIDIRKDSPTFLQSMGLELSAANGFMLYIPEGFAHGFQTLEENSEMIYHHSEYYAPGAEGGLHFQDPAFDIFWPMEPTVMSEKDQAYPLISPAFKGIDLMAGEAATDQENSNRLGIANK